MKAKGRIATRSSMQCTTLLSDGLTLLELSQGTPIM